MTSRLLVVHVKLVACLDMLNMDPDAQSRKDDVRLQHVNKKHAIGTAGHVVLPLISRVTTTALRLLLVCGQCGSSFRHEDGAGLCCKLTLPTCLPFEPNDDLCTAAGRKTVSVTLLTEARLTGCKLIHPCSSSRPNLSFDAALLSVLILTPVIYCWARHSVSSSHVHSYMARHCMQ